MLNTKDEAKIWGLLADRRPADVNRFIEMVRVAMREPHMATFDTRFAVPQSPNASLEERAFWLARDLIRGAADASLWERQRRVEEARMKIDSLVSALRTLR